jgi:MarR-like DNA-binding transcriptional regulator SgrR of sgrS sRNA
MKLAKKPAHSTFVLSERTNTVGEISAEKHYSVLELAELWNLSENTIRRIFENEPGVLKWGSKEGRFKRRYTTLRIPETVVLRVHRRLREAG